ncbi:MAG: inorganic phosphate transporter [Syntrophales bacterium]|jgi:PiT family inorganic phosphate transporter|nr:inorganic phosphate transporter [Syntrophales bacterium]MDD4340179.1 inorganic phosphate transporter [Syntrophales bacterium]HOG08123.1 inorganic phosphate transporter [Syntrophales bacterium]HOS77679.1 inorganic phosphate transporter [Syntrophales bacterium]HPB70665.1 inorganic phosphate transporter [Syntrophales bacterium]
MVDSLYFVIFLVGVALVFDFLNGFHDSANAISTIVSTRVLSPRYAVLWAAFFDFAAVFFIGVPVAKTIGTGIIDPAIVNNYIILAALGGAIIWNIITWWFGLPSSSSHALIGGLIGAGIMKGGTGTLVLSGITKTSLFIVVSPVLGLILGWVLMVIVLNISRNSNVARSEKIFRKLQLVSAAVYSMGHGTNDAQKTMGIIAIILFSKGLLGPTFYVPFWVVITCYTVIALGIMSGGWRIVKTMGTKITKLKPIGGFCAETAAAISIIGASLAGIPVSTTHTITGAIVGVGATRRLTAVRWGVAGSIVWAWILTIPLSALISAILYILINMIG